MPNSPYKTFVTIVDTGSLAATARKLHLSPSAVSKQLSMLEQRLGTQLLQRTTRSIQITDAGELFFQRCIVILNATEAAETEVMELSGTPSGKLTITLPQLLATAEFSVMLQTFRRDYPTIGLELSVSNDLENLIVKNLDVGFRVGPLEDSRLIGRELFHAQTIMCASPDYLQQHGYPRHIKDLANHQLLIPSYLNLSQYSQSSIDTGHPNVTLCDNANMIVELASAGAGLVFMLDVVLESAITREKLIPLQLPADIQPGGFQPALVSLVYTSRDYIPRRLSVFIEYVMGYYQALKKV